jgi:hypothetical protein
MVVKGDGRERGLPQEIWRSVGSTQRGPASRREAAQVLAHGVSAALTGSAVFLVISLVVALVMVGRRRTEPAVADAEGSTALPSANINSPIHPALAGCRMTSTPHASRALKPVTPQRPGKEATTSD